MSLDSFVAACAHVTEPSALWQHVVRFFRSRGIVMISYHLDAGSGGGQAAGAEVSIVEEGFPQDWLERYSENNLRLVDPMPELAARHSAPFYWSDAAMLMDLTPGQQEYMGCLAAAGLGEGLALQVFGPQSRNAFAALGLGPGRQRLLADSVFELQCAAQAAHLRYCALTEAAHPQFHLSPREIEVLRWVARGKSNTVIAEILGLSRHTVDTICRRLFEKLNVNDRTTAAIRGLGAGLLRYRWHEVV